MSYKNQDRIVYQKNNIKPREGQNDPFLLVRWDILTKVSQEFSGKSPFLVYLYLLKWLGNVEEKKDLWFSPTEVARTMGISINSAREGKQALIRAGYLVPVENSEHAYYFEPRA